MFTSDQLKVMQERDIIYTKIDDIHRLTSRDSRGYRIHVLDDDLNSCYQRMLEVLDFNYNLYRIDDDSDSRRSKQVGESLLPTVKGRGLVERSEDGTTVGTDQFPEGGKDCVDAQ